MAVITLKDPYSIKFEEKKFILRRFTGITTDKNTGESKELFTDIGHFGDLPPLFKMYHKLLCKHKADEKEKITLQEFKEMYIEIWDKEIKELLKWAE